MNKLIIVFFSVFFVSCSQKGTAVPKSSLTKKVNQGTIEAIHTDSQNAQEKISEAALDEEQAPASNCTVWFDGCNNCKAKNGKLLSCTKKMCFVMQEPKCLRAK